MDILESLFSAMGGISAGYGLACLGFLIIYILVGRDGLPGIGNRLSEYYEACIGGSARTRRLFYLYLALVVWQIAWLALSPGDPHHLNGLFATLATIFNPVSRFAPMVIMRMISSGASEREQERARKAADIPVDINAKLSTEVNLEHGLRIGIGMLESKLSDVDDEETKQSILASTEGIRAYLKGETLEDDLLALSKDLKSLRVGLDYYLAAKTEPELHTRNGDISFIVVGLRKAAAGFHSAVTRTNLRRNLSKREAFFEETDRLSAQKDLDFDLPPDPESPTEP